MLMDIENIVYKGKSVHVHRNNKNHVSKNQNGKHIHCFLIHMNYIYILYCLKWKEKFFSLVPGRDRFAHFLQKNKFLVKTFAWKVRFR
jgi:hypothetical protein